MADIKVTFEALYDLLRKEKESGDLVALDPQFFEDVASYLKEKQDQLEKTMHKSDMFSSAERDKLMVQIKNAKRILREWYDRRESKIMGLASNIARTGPALTNTESLLPEEKDLFNNILLSLSTRRDTVLLPVLEGHAPLRYNRPLEVHTESPEHDKDISKIQILKHVPQFVGKELEPYGPFENEEITTLPTEIANVLIINGVAKEVESL